jgi:predicted membrane chloride channel (bestrophin family)
MEEAAAMHRYLESRQAAGKLVLEIPINHREIGSLPLRRSSKSP